MRKRTQGGQALVMVTLALVSMCGMLGLAVDLGWSFFVQKQAQAAADLAALSAVQEAVIRLGGGGSNVSGFTCASSGTGAGQVDCEPTAITCVSTSSTSNLHNGCQYAVQNGFDPATNTKQNVTIQSSDGADVNRPPGVNRIAYWVTVRAAQNIPQLFSSVLGNTSGLVAAVATAGIVGAVTPGNFYGMNHKGDCWNRPGEGTTNCGMDIKNGALGNNGACPGGGGGTGTICAPAGVILGSSCAAVGPGCSQAWAGDAGNHHGIMTNNLVVNGTGLAINDWHNSAGNPMTATSVASGPSFRDPTYPNPQPPLQASGTMASCGIKGGNTLTGALGPYQYFHYTTVDGAGRPIPDGAQLRTSNTATFSTSGTCPGWNSTTSGSGGTTQGGSNFPTYVFYGGLNAGGTVNLGPGQYVMAGVNSGPDTTDHVFQSVGTITGDTATGTMFIFTDANYPGLASQRAALPNTGSMPILYQGDLYFKNPDITMSGLVGSDLAGSHLPSTMDAYTGITWWQDRRNSMVEYNQDPSLAPNCSVCTVDNGAVVGCADQSTGQCLATQTLAEIKTDNHVTPSSPGVNLDPGNGTIHLTGVYYQPRGAWVQITHGTGLGSGSLQMLTGSLELTSGNDKILLAGPTNPFITYRASLIQ